MALTYQQSFAWWSFTWGREPSADLLAAAGGIGYRGVEFLPTDLWPVARDSGLELVNMDGHEPLEIGFNDPAHHASLADQVRRSLAVAVEEGVRHVLVASGNRGASSDDDAISICAAGLAPLAAEAEVAGVGLMLEPLNSKIDHPGHQCDRTAWGAAVIDQVGSPALRLLYDVYHMQLMEGDLIRTIEANIGRIGHVHTAGVPGRHDLDNRQEVNWRAIAGALRSCGYTGYVGHEFVPRADPVAALRHAFALFDDIQDRTGACANEAADGGDTSD